MPSDPTKISANIALVINADSKGCQLVIDDGDYEVKYHFYEQLKAIKAGKGTNNVSPIEKVNESIMIGNDIEITI